MNFCSSPSSISPLIVIVAASVLAKVAASAGLAGTKVARPRAIAAADANPLTVLRRVVMDVSFRGLRQRQQPRGRAVISPCQEGNGGKRECEAHWGCCWRRTKLDRVPGLGAVAAAGVLAVASSGRHRGGRVRIGGAHAPRTDKAGVHRSLRPVVLVSPLADLFSRLHLHAVSLNSEIRPPTKVSSVGVSVPKASLANSWAMFVVD